MFSRKKIKGLREEIIRLNQALNNPGNDGFAKNDRPGKEIGNEDLFKLIADVSEDLISITSFDLKPVFIYISPSFEKALGYKPEDLIGKSTFDYIHPGDIKKLKPLLKSYVEKKLQNLFLGKEKEVVEKIQYRVKDINNNWRLIESIGKLIPGNRMLFYSKDITEKDQMLEALVESEEKFRKAFLTSPDSININRLSDGLYVEINKGFTQIMGYTPEEAIGKTSTELNVWADLKDRKKLVTALMEKGSIENLEAKFISKSGETKYGLMSASIIILDDVPHILNITRDITKRKVYQKNWESIFMAISAPTVILNKDFIIQEANSSTLKLSGLSSEEIKGMHCYEVFHSKNSTCPVDGCPMEKMLGNGSFKTVEMEMEAFEGIYLVNCTPILDEEGQLEKVIHIATDITELKAFEARLKESEERYKHLAENASDIIFTTDKNGKFSYANESAISKTGYSSKELMNMSYQDLIHEEYRLRAKHFYTRQILDETKASNFEYPFYNKQGEIVWYNQNATLIFENNEVIGLHLFARDVTEKHKAEEALMESERLKSLILESTDESITYYDRDLNILMLNSKSGIGLNVDNKELHNQKCYEKFCNRQSPCENCSALKAMESGEVQSKEVLINDEYLYEFHYYPVKNEAEEIIGVVEFGKNISEIKKIEKALQESEKNYKLLIEQLPEGVAIHRNGKIIFANKASAKILAANSSDELIGYDIMKVLHQDSREKAITQIQNLYSGKAILNPDFYSLIRMNGTVVDVEIYASIIDYNNEKAIQVVVWDITQRKKAEEELKKYRTQLEDLVSERTKDLENKTSKLTESQKAMSFLLEDTNEIRRQLEAANHSLMSLNKELESFSYSVSHDLRAPLTRMDGFSKALAEDYSDKMDDTAKHYLGRIRASSQHMAILIDDLLNLSRITRQQVVKTRLDISKVSRIISNEIIGANPQCKAEFSIESNLFVNADKRLIKILLNNLIGNAVKFSSKKDNPLIEIGLVKIDERDTVYIRDNGVGFNMNYYDQIFSPFNRLHSDNEYAGSGVGLAIVQRVINKHGGRIWAESEIDKGTTFYFQL